MKLQLTINNQPRACEIAPNERLLDLLRREGYLSVKNGCEEGTCGACVVLVDGLPRNSCLIFAGLMSGRNITTLEGIGDSEHLHPLQKAFIEEGAIQCGYCTPGTILAAKALLDINPDPSLEEVKEALSGNLCRCTGYVKIVKAVLKAAQVMREPL